MINLTMTLTVYYLLCQSCAENIYTYSKPNVQYVNAVTDLLFGTGAVESGCYKWSRQRGKELKSNEGAFSFWQVEIDSIKASLEYARSKPALMRRVQNWLPRTIELEFAFSTAEEIAHESVFSPELGVLLCRLHYLRVKEKVPETIEEQACYWKKYYNTDEGKGKPEQYISSWFECAAKLKE